MRKTLKMHNQTIFLFQELTLKALLETQFYIKKVQINLEIGVKGDDILDNIKNFKSQLNSELVKIFETLQSSDQPDDVIEFFKDIDFNEIYDKFLVYFDKEVEGL